MENKLGPESIAIIPLAWTDTIEEYPGFWPVSKYKTGKCPIQRNPHENEFGYCGGVYIFIGEWMRHGEVAQRFCDER
jgi:hypothetical protein